MTLPIGVFRLCRQGSKGGQMRRLEDLDGQELRVLGCLLEKELATPQNYPLTLKGLVAACNQKTNRKPVVELAEIEVLNVLRVLLQDGLVERVSGARADRWSHRVDRWIGFEPACKAPFALLLLRGPQTPGELRSRSERLHPFDSAAELEAVLQELTAGEEPLVRLQPRLPGQKEARWSLATAAQSEAPSPPPSSSATGEQPPQPSIYARLERLEQEVKELRERIDAWPPPQPRDPD